MTPAPAEETDYIKEGVFGVLRALEGRPGDVVVVVTILLCGYLVKRKRYQGAVGILILAIGMVLLRVLIFLLFGDFKS